jgi:hypothetical protein
MSLRPSVPLLILGILALARPANADDGGEGQVAPGYSVPDIPAMTILNATSNKIDRPASASELGAAVSQVIGADGTVQSGAGIEFSLRTFGVGKRWTFDQYRRDWWRRTLSQSAFSFGTAAATAGTGTPSATTDARAAIGVRIVLWDQADPLLSRPYLLAADYARSQCRDANDPNVAKCREDAFNRFDGWTDPPWNGGGAFLAGALSGLFADSKIQNHAWDDLSIWGAFSFPILSFAQLAIGGVYDHQFNASSNLLAGAARLRIGSKWFRGTGDVTVYAEKPDSQPRGVWAAGVEVQVTSTAWLTANAGTDFGGPSGTGGTFNLLSGIKWGYSSKPSW